MKAYERLLNYVKYDTQSDPTSETSPSTSKQFDLLNALLDELKGLGVEAELSETGYVYGKIPGNVEASSVAFIAHVDTATECSGKDVKPQIIENWNGEDIRLSDEYTTHVDQFPSMKKYVGKSLMVTSGDTLLGADDKAGVAEIMCAVEYWMSHPAEKHGDIYVAFTPDEEIGRGTANFELEKCPAEFGYTMDGDQVGGIEYENFNAASAGVTFTGLAIHPGDSKNRMINAMNVAHTFHSYLPKEKRPEHTEGREGFYHLLEMSGDVEKATLSYIIRNHDKEEFESMKEFMKKVESFINEQYGKDVVSVELKDSYKNMRECFNDKMFIVDLAKEAIEEVGLEVVSKPIRGGTDGASLTYMGMPCPNLGTGCGNFHGRYEYAVLEDMDKAVEVILKIVEKISKRG